MSGPPPHGPRPPLAARAGVAPRRARLWPAVLFLPALFLGAAPTAAAHDLQHGISEGDAVVVRLFYDRETPFSFESYEVYRQGEEIPVQVGRTDSRGRVVFIADGPGAWRVKVFSQDGHGADISFNTGGGDGEAETARDQVVAGGLRDGDIDGEAVARSASKLDCEGGLQGGGTRIVVGVSVIFGVFGLINMFVRRRSPR